MIFCVAEWSRDDVLALENLLVACLYDWVAVCLALMDHMRPYWPTTTLSQDRYHQQPQLSPTNCACNEASFVKQRSGIDPDFRERSLTGLTKRFAPARALSFFWIKKASIPTVAVSLQDGGTLKFLLFATYLQQCFGTEST